MSPLIKPEIPAGSEPSPDDDPTGVRALLSSLPEPDPMPQHLVERINASLAAEQAQRAARMSGTSVSPMLVTDRGRLRARRPARLMLAIAGAAAAVALLAVVGTNMFTPHQPTTVSGSAALTATSSAEARVAAPPGNADKAPAAASAAPAASPSLVEIALSGTRYTPADFVTQIRPLRLGTLVPTQPQAARSPSVGPAVTRAGLLACLSAIGATGAEVVRADVAFYAGQPALIIVATTAGRPVAYAVGRECSGTDAAVFRGATPLP